MNHLEVYTHYKNREYPTRVTILDFNGYYDAPYYYYSVYVQVEFYHVLHGQEDKLVTFCFWTERDSCWCDVEDEESCMTDEEAEEWFEECIMEDLSFCNLEGLEKLDLYEAGIPLEIRKEEDAIPYIISAIQETCGDIIDECDCNNSCDCYNSYFSDDAYQNGEDELSENEEEDYSGDIEYVIDVLNQYQQEIAVRAAEDRNGYYELYVEDILGDSNKAIGILYSERTYYMCFGNPYGQGIEYQEYGMLSRIPFTIHEIRDYVEEVFSQLME